MAEISHVGKKRKITEPVTEVLGNKDKHSGEIFFLQFLGGGGSGGGV